MEPLLNRNTACIITITTICYSQRKQWSRERRLGIRRLIRYEKGRALYGQEWNHWLEPNQIRLKNKRIFENFQGGGERKPLDLIEGELNDENSYCFPDLFLPVYLVSGLTSSPFFRWLSFLDRIQSFVFFNPALKNRRRMKIETILKLKYWNK